MELRTRRTLTDLNNERSLCQGYDVPCWMDFIIVLLALFLGRAHWFSYIVHSAWHIFQMIL